MTRFVEAGSAAGFLFLPALEAVPDRVRLFVRHEPKASSSSFFVASVGAVSADTVEECINTRWERPWTKKRKEEAGGAPGV